MENNENETNLPAVGITTEIIPTEEQIHDISTKVTAISMLNNTLSTFVDDICEEVRQENDYIKELQAVALKDAKAGKMKPNELIALLTSATSNKNDLVSKVVSPSMQLLAQAQQNELAERREMMKEKEAKAATPSNIRQIADIAPGEVLVGLQSLFSQALAVKTVPQQQQISSSETIIVKHELTDEEKDETPFGSKA